MSTIAERVSECIVDQLGVIPDQMKPETRLAEDLAADSLDLVELVMALETEFAIEIADEDAEKLKTVKDVTDWLEKAGVE